MQLGMLVPPSLPVLNELFRLTVYIADVLLGVVRSVLAWLDHQMLHSSRCLRRRAAQAVCKVA